MIREHEPKIIYQFLLMIWELKTFLFFVFVSYHYKSKLTHLQFTTIYSMHNAHIKFRIHFFVFETRNFWQLQTIWFTSMFVYWFQTNDDVFERGVKKTLQSSNEWRVAACSTILFVLNNCDFYKVNIESEYSGIE